MNCFNRSTRICTSDLNAEKTVNIRLRSMLVMNVMPMVICLSVRSLNFCDHHSHRQQKHGGRENIWGGNNMKFKVSSRFSRQRQMITCCKDKYWTIITFLNIVVTIYTTWFNIQKICVLPTRCISIYPHYGSTALQDLSRFFRFLIYTQ
jgi:hypothetical protein